MQLEWDKKKAESNLAKHIATKKERGRYEEQTN